MSFAMQNAALQAAHFSDLIAEQEAILAGQMATRRLYLRLLAALVAGMALGMVCGLIYRAIFMTW